MKAGMNNYRHIFGPVPSRRLGRSLGVDLTPFKTCTLDCIFCQLGQTTNKTLDRHEYAPVWHVESELDAWIKEGGKADYITLSGSGEPTLHTRFGEVLQFVRERTAIPTALLSNGTLFWRPEVREAAKRAHMVKLSLSAWDQSSFEHVNRPHRDLEFECVVEGQRAFRDEFQGKLWVEVFLLWGVNTVERDIEKIAALIESIGPDEIHLNTAVRPPAQDFALAVPRKQMEAMAGLFHPPTKVIAEFAAGGPADIEANEGNILALLQRRPCTAQQIAEVFGMHLSEVSKYVGKLSRTGKLRAQATGPDAYYVAVEPGGNRHADL
jgi:wyosine [tRNA(Phe)-imidazoG37] synthetase (radical SAM superfamily)